MYTIMGLSTNLTLLIGGLGIGLGIALLGGVAEYRLSLRASADTGERRLPGCLLYVAGGLALAGIVSIAASLFSNGGIRPALVLGAGVLGGFYVGFIVLFIIWFLIER